MISSATYAGRRFGPYMLVERLGEGGMAEVWKAVREAEVGGSGAKKTVALKVIAGHAEDRADYKRMFLREMRLSMKLSHASIVQVFDAGEIDGKPYLVMEFVNGLSLDQLLRRLAGEVLPYTTIAHIVGQVLQALAYAHDLEDDDSSVSIVHRDISPQNILVSTSGEVKVADFGIASTSAEAATGSVRGKIQYMPPEQLTGDSRSPSLDLFSVGAVLHELIDNRPFREAVDNGRMLWKVAQGETPALQRGDVPRTLAVLRKRLLERDPDRRPTARTALQYLFKWEGYRNASLELGELVKRLRAIDLDFSDDEEGYQSTGSAAHATLLSATQQLVPLSTAERPVTATMVVPLSFAEATPTNDVCRTSSGRSAVVAGEFSAPVATEILPIVRGPVEVSHSLDSVRLPPASGLQAVDQSHTRPPMPAQIVPLPHASPSPPSPPSPAATAHRSRAGLVILLPLAGIAFVLAFAAIRFGGDQSVGPDLAVAKAPPDPPLDRPPEPGPPAGSSPSLGGETPKQPLEMASPPAVATPNREEPVVESIVRPSNPPPEPKPDPKPKSLPPPAVQTVSLTLTAASEYKLWVQVLIGDKEYTVDWPNPTVRARVKPGSYVVKYRRTETGTWIVAGKIQVSNKSSTVTLQGGKVSIK